VEVMIRGHLTKILLCAVVLVAFVAGYGLGLRARTVVDVEDKLPSTADQVPAWLLYNYTRSTGQYIAGTYRTKAACAAAAAAAGIVMPAPWVGCLSTVLPADRGASGRIYRGEERKP
jgi:hypothetical protein